jgi:hypothetical protein
MCLLNAIGTMVLFEVLLLKNHFFHKEEFSNEILQLVIYFIYSCYSMSHIFENEIWVDMNFFKCIDFTRFCVLFRKMNTMSNYTITCLNVQVFFLGVINYNFPLNNIYIASHLHVVKDSWTLKKPWFFINKKLKTIWKFEYFLYVSNSILLLQKTWTSKKFYYKN